MEKLIYKNDSRAGSVLASFDVQVADGISKDQLRSMDEDFHTQISTGTIGSYSVAPCSGNLWSDGTEYCISTVATESTTDVETTVPTTEPSTLSESTTAGKIF